MKRHLILALAALLLLALLAGCDLTPSDQQAVQSFAEDWARTKGLYPVNEDESINWEAVRNVGQRFFTGSTGDAETDAALQTSDLIAGLLASDRLASTGLRNADAAAIDAAIAAQPDQWIYRVSRAALALIQGDMSTYTLQMDAAAQIQTHDEVDPRWFAERSVAALEYAEGLLRSEPSATPAQCRELYSALSSNYGVLYQLTADANYQTQQAWASGQVGGCQ
jgi:hypothetical protein